MKLTVKISRFSGRTATFGWVNTNPYKSFWLERIYEITSIKDGKKRLSTQ